MGLDGEKVVSPERASVMTIGCGLPPSLWFTRMCAATCSMRCTPALSHAAILLVCPSEPRAAWQFLFFGFVNKRPVSRSHADGGH